MNWMNASRKPVSSMTNRQVSRGVLLSTRAAMLCKECDPTTVNRVVDHFPNGETKLDCGHRRRTQEER